MDVMVVGRRAVERWRLLGVLGQVPGAAAALELAASRLAHPSTRAPDAVVLVVEDHADLQWLRAHVGRSPRAFVPVVAVVAGPNLVGRARRAGAAAVVDRSVTCDRSPRQLRTALRQVTAPAEVIPLPRARTA